MSKSFSVLTSALVLAVFTAGAASAQERVPRQSILVAKTLGSIVDPAAAVLRHLEDLPHSDGSEVVLILPTDASSSEAQAYRRLSEVSDTRLLDEVVLDLPCDEGECPAALTRTVVILSGSIQGRTAEVEFGVGDGPHYTAELTMEGGGGWSVVCYGLSSRRCSGG